MGIYIDPLTAIMLMVVTIVAGLVQIYSLGYMHGDPRFARYYAYLSLFTFSMLGLVLAGTYVLMFVFWELVGLTSYLLNRFLVREEERRPMPAKKLLSRPRSAISDFWPD